ncbi:glycosyltransferase family 4 protein [Priestia megaterium]
MAEKKTILIFTPYYIPGFKGGGPIRSISNLVDRLGNDFNFKIITYDRDLGDESVYDGIVQNSWNDLGNAKVFYASHKWLSFANLKSLLKNTDYDSIYLNSFFSFKFSMVQVLLRKLKLVPHRPIILAPRGEFSPGALNIKKLKKSVFIKLSKLVGMYSNIIWHSTSFEEQEHIKQQFGNTVSTHIVPNLPAISKDDFRNRKKEKKSLKLVFLSRISPKKNLDGALRMLREVSFPLTFNIYGPIEDLEYWKECQKIMKILPSNIMVNYKGEVNNNKVQGVFEKHDAFFFPTHGENYGHVIVEALSSKCLVILSDQTPWRSLEKSGVGWDIPLEEQHHFSAVFKDIYNMDDIEMKKRADNINKYIDKHIIDESVVENSIMLFSSSLERD